MKVTGTRHVVRRLTTPVAALPLARETVRLARNRLLGQKIVLVFQMGKVGSQTLTSSLKAAGVPTYSLHFLSHKGLKEAEQSLRERGVSRLPRHLYRSRAWRRMIDKGHVPPLKVITLTREPVSRELANAFENVVWRYPVSLDGHGGLDIDAIALAIYEQLSTFDESSDYASNWFDHELRTVFGVDVYEHEFDKERGYTTLRQDGGGPPLMVIRLESLDAALRDALPAYVGLNEPIPIQRENLGEMKWYADAYRQVKERFRLPRELCEKIYASRYARHFYSNADIDRFVRRWSS